jgi:hypothetical protein
MADNNEDKIRNDTHILISVAFKEQSGSTQRYTAETTVAKLGLDVEAEGKIEVPSEEKLREAIAYDNAHPQTDLTKTKWFALSTALKASNNDNQQSVSMRIREAVVGFLKKGGLDGHPIDQSKYVFDGGPSSLSLSPMHDDAKGSITGHPGVMYLNLQASATWGK